MNPYCDIGPPSTVPSTDNRGAAVTFWQTGWVMVEFWITVYIAWHPPLTPKLSNWRVLIRIALDWDITTHHADLVLKKCILSKSSLSDDYRTNTPAFQVQMAPPNPIYPWFSSSGCWERGKRTKVRPLPTGMIKGCMNVLCGFEFSYLTTINKECKDQYERCVNLHIIWSRRILSMEGKKMSGATVNQVVNVPLGGTSSPSDMNRLALLWKIIVLGRRIVTLIYWPVTGIGTGCPGIS